MPPSASRQLPCFIAESTLGRLVKWLRLAGFDTELAPGTPDFGRLNRIALDRNRTILSRTRSVMRRVDAGRGVFIPYDTPLEQARQVIQYFNIRRGDLKPFSRCSTCNQPLEKIDKNYLLENVPDYINQRHDRFLTCPCCRRVFWPGSHSGRISALIDSWFDSGVHR